jgi:hypothetical protein
LTLMAALAAELDVGLMAFTRHTPSGGGRLLTLRSRRPSCHSLRPLRVGSGQPIR